MLMSYNVTMYINAKKTKQLKYILVKLKRHLFSFVGTLHNASFHPVEIELSVNYIKHTRYIQT